MMPNPTHENLFSSSGDYREQTDRNFGVKRRPNLGLPRTPDLNLLKSAGGGGKAGICMDRRLQKELVEQGILTVEDLPKTTPEDEILTEIKKCQQELATVNEYNLEELNKLRTIVAKDLRRQEVKEALDKIDNQVLEMYNKLLLTKQKHVQQTEDEDMDKNVFSDQISKDFEVQVDAILKQQILLHREITELSDIPLLN